MNVSDFIIFQLVTFKYDLVTGASQKFIPNLRIETQILCILLGTLSLHAIIYHLGNNPRSRHFTSAVKHNEIWFSVDDECI